MIQLASDDPYRHQNRFAPVIPEVQRETPEYDLVEVFRKREMRDRGWTDKTPPRDPVVIRHWATVLFRLASHPKKSDNWAVPHTDVCGTPFCPDSAHVESAT